VRARYRTLGGAGLAEYEEKKSRFIGAARPVASEAEALSFLAEVRAEHRSASHNVYAYSAGEGVPAKRFSDDGEPQGTAGVPVLDVIEKGGLEDVAIVVTRYFGGTLLGAAGLIRAYGKAASMAAEAAGVVERSLARELAVLVEYPLLGLVKNEIEKSGYVIRRIQYGVDAELTVQVPHAAAEAFCARVSELTADAALVEPIGNSYITVPATRARDADLKEARQ
jgi:uncharacterized YigZ family protein